MPAVLNLTWRADKPAESETEPPAGTWHAIYRGDSYELTIRLWEDTAKTVPHNPVGTLSAQIRTERLEEGDAAATPDGEGIVDVVDNVVTMTFPADVTRDLADRGFYDLQEAIDDTTVVTWLTGKTVVWGDVTA